MRTLSAVAELVILIIMMMTAATRRRRRITEIRFIDVDLLEVRKDLS